MGDKPVDPTCHAVRGYTFTSEGKTVDECGSELPCLWHPPTDESEVERLRRGLRRVMDRHDKYQSRGPYPTEYSKAHGDGYVTALATCSLIAQEFLDPEEWEKSEAEWRGASMDTDREWFDRTGRCGHCGNLGAYCCCTAEDPCGCGPHELATEPLPCYWCGGTGIGMRPPTGERSHV
jgi:hypothetical protein